MFINVLQDRSPCFHVPFFKIEKGEININVSPLLLFEKLGFDFFLYKAFPFKGLVFSTELLGMDGDAVSRDVPRGRLKGLKK